VKKKSTLLLVIIIPLLLVACWMGVSIYIRASKEVALGISPIVLVSELVADMDGLAPEKGIDRPEVGPSTDLVDFEWSATRSGFPGDVGLTFLMFVGFVPLFRMEQLVYQSSEAPQRTKVFRYSFHAFVLWNILSTYWLSNASIPAGIFAILANSALMALTVVLLHQSRKLFHALTFYLLSLIGCFSNTSITAGSCRGPGLL
jgi:hypothetical protein